RNLSGDPGAIIRLITDVKFEHSAVHADRIGIRPGTTVSPPKDDVTVASGPDPALDGKCVRHRKSGIVGDFHAHIGAGKIPGAKGKRAADNAVDETDILHLTVAAIGAVTGVAFGEPQRHGIGHHGVVKFFHFHDVAFFTEVKGGERTVVG